MRIRVKLDGMISVINIIWADFDGLDCTADFLSQDEDWISVKMSHEQWEQLSKDLLINGWLDLIYYYACSDNIK